VTKQVEATAARTIDRDALALRAIRGPGFAHISWYSMEY
jgi:hypothetical protein